jgi:hypothetical protein
MIPYRKEGNLYLINPIPVWKRELTSDDVGMQVDVFNEKLVSIATEFYSNWEIEVPDERHIDKSQISYDYFLEMDNREFFKQNNEPSVGKWHAVKPNNFLDLQIAEVQILKNILLSDYRNALNQYEQIEEGSVFNLTENTSYVMDESWIQFYKNGDYKVLHNHLRYWGDVDIHNIWAGGYYIDDGNPDIYQPYSGRFEFNIRNSHYIVKPTNGMILLWPGDILHMVHPFYGDGVRKCINFNLSTR